MKIFTIFSNSWKLDLWDSNLIALLKGNQQPLQAKKSYAMTEHYLLTIFEVR